MSVEREEAARAVDRLQMALDRLGVALQRDPERDELVLDATIQRFEFSVELLWEALQKVLWAGEGIEARSPKDALRKAYAMGWLEDESLWLSMLQDRNLTSHTYREALARQIHQRIPGYLEAMQGVANSLGAILLRRDATEWSHGREKTPVCR